MVGFVVSGSHVEQILSQTRRTVALTSQQVLSLTRMPRGQLCALAVVLSRWRASVIPPQHPVTKRLRKRAPIARDGGLEQITPGAIYTHLVAGEKLLPEQLAALRDWSLPNLLALIVMLQSDLVSSSSAVPLAGAVSGNPVTRQPANQSSKSGSRYRSRRRSRRIVRDRWLGAAGVVAVLIASPLLSNSETGQAVIQASLPFLIGAASVWLYGQGRWLTYSQNHSKVIAGRIAVSTAAFGCLFAGALILAELARAALSIGASFLGFASLLV